MSEPQHMKLNPLHMCSIQSTVVDVIDATL